MLPLDDLRRTLLEQRRRVFEQVAHVGEDLRWLDDNVEIEIEEEGQEENIARLLARLDQRARVQLDAIDAALARMANDDYGRCDGCGEAIPLERLRVVPTATKCVPCAGTAP
jgi:RNA polymerase-binding protein DksA